MPKPSRIGLMLVGGMLAAIASWIGLEGDDAFAAGNRVGAIAGHCTALIIMLAALGCYCWAFVLSVKRLGTVVRTGGLEPVSERERQAVRRTAANWERSADEPLDTDAIVARYLTQRDATPPTPAQPRGFGRRQP